MDATPPLAMNSFNLNLKTLRKKFDFSYAMLDEVLGLNSGTYQKYEEDKAEMPYEIIEKVAAIYNLDPADLFSDDFQNEVNHHLVCFRANNMSTTTLKTIALFNQMVSQYAGIYKLHKQSCE